MGKISGVASVTKQSCCLHPARTNTYLVIYWTYLTCCKIIAPKHLKYR